MTVQPQFSSDTVRPVIEPGRGWAYLDTPAFRSRYVLAAHHLDDIDDIVEIGGYRTPITGFLTRPKRSVTVIDPQMTPSSADTLCGAPCRVRHLAACFQDVPDLPARYGLALLGLDLELYEGTRAQRRRTLDQFAPIVRAADRIVVEFAVDWTASRWLAGWVEETSGLRRTLDLTLDLRGDLGIDLSTSWPPLWRRRLRVLGG